MADPLVVYRCVNVDGTRRLAEAAARCGVRRFVFLSTVKVCGEGADRPYADGDPADPRDPYSLSKWEAEQALAAIAGKSGLQVVVLRPPLVFGPGVKANFLRLLRLVDMGVPLPLASVHNARSMIYVGNLTDAIAACADSEAAVGGTFLVADSEAPSTPQLIRTMAAHLGRPSRLLPMPVHWLCRMGSWLGRESEIQRLVSSLVVAPEAIVKAVGWQPRCGFDQAMAATVRWYRQVRK
jgi:nucleoside-diphosphate-sugar epimerase